MKTNWRALAAALALGASALPFSAMAGDYTVLTTGRPSGAMSVTVNGAERQVAYSYNDRGRGPDLKETFRVDANGMIQSASIKGVDYLKAPVDESFTRQAGKATWSSQADAGSSDKPGFYSTYQGSPEDGAA